MGKFSISSIHICLKYVAGGLAGGILSSGSTFASSTISNGINVALGAQWQKQYGGYEFGVAYDQQSKYTLLDYYNEAMKKSGGFLGGLTKQAIDNITGVSDGWTFNILNTKDLGLKGVNASGLLAITVGGSKGFSWDISSSGLDISYSGIKDMLFGMKRAAKYTSFTSTKEKTAVYIAENMLLYSGVKDTEQVIENIENYLYGQGDIKIDFSTEENKRIDNTIYISKKLLSSSQHYDGNVAIINGFSQYGILAASLAHESKHDGKNKIDPKQAEKAQQDLNIYLSAGMTYEQAIEQIKKDYGQEVGKEIDEDIDAHTYETVIWGGLKEKFGVSDIELDQKLSIYKDLGKDIFKGYLTWKYELGHEKEKTKDKYNASGLLALMNNCYMGEKEKNKNLEAWISILKGFVKIENGNELYEMLDKAGIINNIYSGYLAMFKKGYNVEKVKNEIEGLSINVLSSKNVLEEVINSNDKYKEIEKYINLDKIPSIDLINIIASFVKDTGKNGKENEKDKNNAALLMWDIIKKGGDSAKTQVINIINCGIKEFEEIKKMNELKNKINNDYKDINEKIREQMNNLLQNWTENVLKKLRENNNTYSVEKTYNTKVGYGKDLNDNNIVRFKEPLCNIGTSNYLNLMGYDGCSVISPDFFDDKEGIYYAKSKERLEDKSYVANATKLIENIESKVDDFTSFEQILNFAQLKSLSVEQFKNTINTIFQLFSAAGYAVIGTMKNNNQGEASHLFPIYNGLALDINFQYKINGVFQWGQGVPLWVPLGATSASINDKFYEILRDQGTFDVSKDKEAWIKNKIEKLLNEINPDTNKKYTKKEATDKAYWCFKIFDNYLINFYILNYPVYMFSNAWGFTNFYY